MTAYQCPKCGLIYQKMTHDGMCERVQCLGIDLVECTGQTVPPVPVTTDVGVIEGLCLLVCDISYSMGERAFANSKDTKLQLVTQAIENAVAELYRISKPDEAFIGIIAFGSRAAVIRDRKNQPFLLPVRQIELEFGADGLQQYLLDSFQADEPSVGLDRTDITAALRLARTIYDEAVAGSLSISAAAGKVNIMKHTDIVTHDRDRISVSNVRILIYSDGQHNPETEGPLINAFEDVYPSPLMTAFLGDESMNEESRRGADQMRSLANRCVRHQKAGYFLINNPAKDAVLRNLFRMASGASGFCPECLSGYIDSLEEEEDERPWEGR
jgi:hypothetical protein